MFSALHHVRGNKKESKAERRERNTKTREDVNYRKRLKRERNNSDSKAGMKGIETKGMVALCIMVREVKRRE